MVNNASKVFFIIVLFSYPLQLLEKSCGFYVSFCASFSCLIANSSGTDMLIVANDCQALGHNNNWITFVVKSNGFVIG